MANVPNLDLGEAVVDDSWGLELVRSVRDKKAKRRMTQKRRLEMLKSDTARFSVPAHILAEYRDIFSAIDQDGNGLVSAEELAKHFQVPVGRVHQLVKQDLDWGQFVQMAMDEKTLRLLESSVKDGHAAMPDHLRAEYKEVFDLVDKDGNGFVTVPEIVAALHLPEDRAREIVRLGDMEGNKELNFEEFLVAMTSAEANRQLEAQARVELPPQLPPELQAQYRAIFDAIDKDHSGGVSVGELAEHFQLPQHKVAGLVRRIESGGNELDWDGFLRLVMDDQALHLLEQGSLAHAIPEHVRNEYREIFDCIAKDSEGAVTAEAIVKALRLPPDNARKIVELGDINGDGRLSFEGFLHAMTSVEANLQREQRVRVEVPPELHAQYRAIFDAIDVDNSGGVSVGELALHFGVPTHKIAPIVQRKAGGAGGLQELDWDAFLRLVLDEEALEVLEGGGGGDKGGAHQHRQHRQHRQQQPAAAASRGGGGGGGGGEAAQRAIPPALAAEYEAIFRAIDKDNSGTVSVGELKEVLHLSDHDAANIVELGGGDELTLAAFMQAMSNPQARLVRDEVEVPAVVKAKHRSLFMGVRGGANGKVSVSELATHLRVPNASVSKLVSKELDWQGFLALVEQERQKREDHTAQLLARLPPAVVRQFEELFALMDADRDGKTTTKQMARALRLPEARVRAMMRGTGELEDVMGDGDERWSFGDFVRVMTDPNTNLTR